MMRAASKYSSHSSRSTRFVMINRPGTPSGGAGANATKLGGAGGSGVVIVKEEAGTTSISGVWSLEAVYENVSAGTWS